MGADGVFDLGLPVLCATLFPLFAPVALLLPASVFMLFVLPLPFVLNAAFAFPESSVVPEPHPAAADIMINAVRNSAVILLRLLFIFRFAPGYMYVSFGSAVPLKIPDVYMHLVLEPHALAHQQRCLLFPPGH